MTESKLQTVSLVPAELPHVEVVHPFTPTAERLQFSQHKNSRGREPLPSAPRTKGMEKPFWKNTQRSRNRSADAAGNRTTPGRLTRLMSDVISLRERVAQAELESHLYRFPSDRTQKDD